MPKVLTCDTRSTSHVGNRNQYTPNLVGNVGGFGATPLPHVIKTFRLSHIVVTNDIIAALNSPEANFVYAI